MDAPATTSLLNEDVDILGQQPMRIYTQICSCFSLSDQSSVSRIIDTLTEGLVRLTASFPWIAGQVVSTSSGDGNASTTKIQPYEKIPCLAVKDLRSDASAPTMDDLRQAIFPMRMLDETIFAPRNTLPGTPGDAATDDKAPVFLVQATFIKGGLVLCFNGQHQTMDMVGQGQVIDLFAKACHGEPFTREELSSGNLPRRDLFPLLDDGYEQGPEVSKNIIIAAPPSDATNGTSDTAPQPPTSECSWAYFSFSAKALAALKTLASETVSSGFVSTDDTLTAFVWQCITRARQPRLEAITKVSFARAVDARRYLNVPATYPGLLQNMTYHTYTLQDLISQPLGAIASAFRTAVDSKTSDIAYRTRALATVLDRSADKSIVSFIANMDFSKDIALSSWAKIDLRELDFNLGLGKPECVRRPRLMPVESLLYLMPKAPNGEIAVAVCLREEDMKRLREDETFSRYGIYIG